jgi:putative transposase
MKAKRFTEEQIIGVLKEAEAGAKTKDLCRKHGISEPTFRRHPCIE